MIGNDQHVSDLRWDRWLADDLPCNDREAIEAHAAACEHCSQRLRTLTSERDALADRPIPSWLSPRSRRTRAAVIGIVGVAAAAAIGLALVRHDPGELPKGRGGPELVLEAGRPDALTRLTSGDAIHPGQYLQAGYSASHDGYGAVLSVDGSGTALAYVPSRGQLTVALPAGRARSFPESTVLDEVVGAERIAILWCDATRPIAPLLAELRTTHQLVAPPGCSVRVIELDKRADH